MFTLREMHSESVLTELRKLSGIFFYLEVMFIIIIMKMDLQAILKYFVDVAYFPCFSIFNINFISYFKLFPVSLCRCFSIIHRPLITIKLYFNHKYISVF